VARLITLPLVATASLACRLLNRPSRVRPSLLSVIETRRWLPPEIENVRLPMITVLLVAVLATPSVRRPSTSVRVAISLHV